MVQSADRGIKNGFDDAWRMLRRIPPLAQMILALRNKIVQRLRRFALPECVDQNELDFHFLRQDRFDVHAGAHSGGSVLVGFCQPGEVRGKLYKYAVAFHRTDDAGDGLPGGEHGGVFCPSAEQFPVRQMNASRFHLAHDYPDGLPDGETVTGMGDTGDGDGIDGEQGWDAAADVHKCAEFFQVRDNCRQDVTRRTVGEILLPAFLLDDAPGEDCHRQTGCVLFYAQDAETDRFPGTCDQCDVFCRAFCDAHCALFPWDDATHTRQGNGEIMAAVTEDGTSLQDHAGVHGVFHGGYAAQCSLIFRRMQPAAFWCIDHFLTSR